MALTAKSTGTGDFEPLATGLHHGVCYGIVDLGTQPSNSPKFKDSRKIAILWEVPSERIEYEKDGKKYNNPRGVSGMWTLSLSEKSKLRPMLESWRGKPFTAEELEGFDVKKVLGANCYLNIVHKNGSGQNAGKVYANVASVNPLPRGAGQLKPENPLIWFSIEECQGEINVPATVPDWLKAKIMQSAEYKKDSPGHQEPTDAEAANQTGGDEDVPF